MVEHLSVSLLTWKSLGTFDLETFEHFCEKRGDCATGWVGWRPVVYLGAGRKMGQLGKNLRIRVVKCEEERRGTPTRGFLQSNVPRCPSGQHNAFEMRK